METRVWPNENSSSVAPGEANGECTAIQLLRGLPLPPRLELEGTRNPAWDYREQGIRHQMAPPGAHRVRARNGCGFSVGHAHTEAAFEAGGEETSYDSRHAPLYLQAIGSYPIGTSLALGIISDWLLPSKTWRVFEGRRQMGVLRTTLW